MSGSPIRFPHLATSLALSTAVMLGLATEASAQATQHRVRVSVKRVLGPGGALHANFAEQVVEQRLRNASIVLNRELGIQLVLSEIIDLPDPAPIEGVPSWFTVVNHTQLSAMEQAAMEKPTLYGWRSNAINLYLIQNHYAGGTCASCSAQQGEIIVISPSILNNSVGWAHEFGHYFGLRHTFEGPQEAYAPPSVVSPNWATAGDLIMDTPADPYDNSLSPAQNIAALNAWWGSTSQHFPPNSAPFLTLRNNVMSYYSGITVENALFTPGQRLRAMAVLAQHRQHVVEPTFSTHYTDLGYERPGEQGAPILDLSPPRLGRRLHLEVSRAAVSSTTLMVLGLTPAFGPIGSGTLVPSNDLVLWTATDPNGTANQFLDLPNIRDLAGLSLYMQGLTLDSSAPGGFTLTNGAGGDVFHRVESDFNGDGYADVAIGVADEAVNGSLGAGAINVIYGGNRGLASAAQAAQTWHQDSPGIAGGCETDDSFGRAIAHGDFNGDGYADLAIGVPGEGIGSSSEAGGVHVLYGSSSGLTATGSQFWEQGTTGLVSVARESFDRFGETLAAGDLDGDGFADLAIGAPSEDIGSVLDAGAVTILYGSSAGLAVAGNETWHQDSSGMPGLAETGDRFGESLAIGDFDDDSYADLVIGVPREDVGSITDAGAAYVLRGSAGGLTLTGNQSWHQDAADVLGEAEIGDRFGTTMAIGDFNGDGFADLAIGIPYEDGDNAGATGSVQTFYGGSNGLSNVGGGIWTQASVGVYGAEEANDWFGYALAANDFDGDGIDDLAVGVPGEDLGTTIAAGMVNILEGGPCGLSGGNGRHWHQDVAAVAGTADPGDLFGYALTTGDLDGNGCADLMVGVPKEDVGSAADAGIVQVLYGQRLIGLSQLYNTVLQQGIYTVTYAGWSSVISCASAEASDRFGSSLSK